MEEAFLHFVWKFQQFDHQSIRSDSDLAITIFEPGFKNSDAGPDFKNAKIKIGDIVWNGHVEIHVKASDWQRHQHQKDPSYNNVILHVVWENDAIIKRIDGTVIPTLQLKDMIDDHILRRYQELLIPENEILCHKYLPEIKELTILSMLDKALARRLEAKSSRLFRDVALTNHNWEEIAWRTLARNFGFKTNSDPFRDLAKSLPLNVLKKESSNHLTLEALLFGQAGFLDEDSKDDYHESLKKEYVFKAKKYRLEKKLHRHQWKFLRLRPANFPTVRIAQLAKLVSVHPNLFTLFVNHDSVKSLIEILSTEQSDYWKKHYDFRKKAKSDIGNLGIKSIENILINTVVPLLFAYGIHKDNEDLKEKALDILSNFKAENNHIISQWKNAGLEVKNAFDSQALIEQFNGYCLKKQCLNCPIGTDIIRLA